MSRGPVAGAASQAVVHAAALLLHGAALALLLPHLGPARAATYVVVISVVGLLSSLLDGAVGPNVLREVTGRPRPAFLRTAVLVRVGVGLLAGLAGAAALAVWWRTDDGTAWGALLAGAGAALHAAAATLALVAVRDQRWAAAASPEIARGAGALVATAVVVAVDGGVVAALAVLPAAGLAGLVSGWLVAGRPVPSGLRPEAAALSALRDGSVVLGLATACAASLVRVAVLLSSATAGAAVVGDVALVARVAEPALLIVGLLATTAMPALSDQTAAPALVRRLLVQAVPAGFLVGAALALTAPYVVAVLGGGRFPGAVAPLRVLAVVLALATVAAPAWAALLAARRDRALLAAGAAGLVVTCLAVAALTPSLGATGTLVGVLAGQAVLLAVSASAALRTGRRG